MKKLLMALCIIPSSIIAAEERVNMIQSLPLSYNTAHFELYCKEESKAEVLQLLQTAEKNVRQLSKQYQHEYSNTIKLYVFPTAEEFHNACGNQSSIHNTIMSIHDEKHAIYTFSPYHPGPTLSAQVIIFNLISGLNRLFINDAFPNKVPDWFCDGIGDLMAGWCQTTLLRALAADHSKIPTLPQLEKTDGKYPKGMISLNCGFSIAHFIWKEYGWRTMLAILSDYSSFEAILGMTKAEFGKRWIAYLDATYQ